MNVDPRGFKDAKDWSEASILPLSKLMIVPILQHGDRWREWAYTVIQSPRVARLTPPDPRHFDDWRDWAYRFNQAVPL